MFFIPYGEKFSNAMLEVIAHGLTIVATNIGAVVDMIENCVGVAVPVYDVNAMQSVLINLKKSEKS